MKLYQVLATFSLSIASTAGQAGCVSPEATFLSCTVEGGKQLAVCIKGDALTYAFGPAGAPELSMSVPLAEAAYRPWNGVGRSIWETISFTRGDVSYLVFGGVDRGAAGEEAASATFGGVEVARGDATVATLNCRADGITFPWTEAIGDAKRAAGLEWHRESESWQPVKD